MIHLVKTEQAAIMNEVAIVSGKPLEKVSWIPSQHPLPVKPRRTHE
jgi:hypothetical protein